MSTSADPQALRSLAVIHLPRREWYALEPVLDALAARGCSFGSPVEQGGQWCCECGPLKLLFSERDGRWTVSLPVSDDNPVTRALLKTIDAALRTLPGVERVEWYKREDRGGAPALSPIQS